MNSFTGIFWQHFKPPHAPPMYWLKPPPIKFWRAPPPHVLNTCGKPWISFGGIGNHIASDRCFIHCNNGSIVKLNCFLVWKMCCRYAMIWSTIYYGSFWAVIVFILRKNTGLQISFGSTSKYKTDLLLFASAWTTCFLNSMHGILLSHLGWCP